MFGHEVFKRQDLAGEQEGAGLLTGGMGEAGGEAVGFRFGSEGSGRQISSSGAHETTRCNPTVRCNLLLATITESCR